MSVLRLDAHREDHGCPRCGSFRVVDRGTGGALAFWCLPCGEPFGRLDVDPTLEPATPTPAAPTLRVVEGGAP